MKVQQAVVSAGLASRRKAEWLVRQGKVTVNGKAITDPVVEVDPRKDDIRVEGKRALLEERVTLLLHKPTGVMTTLHDPEGRRTVAALVQDVGVRLFPVGRLDYHTQGVLLLTNDGALANSLLHPSRQIERVYHVKMRGRVTARAIDLLQRGVTLEDGRARADRVLVIGSTGKHTWLEMAIHEGRNRQIHRMALRVGHPVIKLVRVSFAGLRVDELRPGQWRYLTKLELSRLRTLAAKPQEPRLARAPRSPERARAKASQPASRPGAATSRTTRQSRKSGRTRSRAAR